MRILYYTHSWYPFISGITLRYKQFVDHLKMDNEIVLLTPYDSPEYPGITTYRIDSMEIPDFYLKNNDTRNVRLANSVDISIITNIITVCKLHNIDIIHASCPDPFQLVLKCVSDMLNIPLVVMFHTNTYEYQKTYNIPQYISFIPQYIINTISKPDLILFPSNSSKQLLINNGLLTTDNNIKILPIYANTLIFYPSEPTHTNKWTVGKTKLLYVGRVELEKNIGEILDIMDDTMSLCIVGKGNDSERLRQISTERILDVKFVGLVDNDKLRYWYSSAEIVVMPSS